MILRSDLRSKFQINPNKTIECRKYQTFYKYRRDLDDNNIRKNAQLMTTNRHIFSDSAACGKDYGRGRGRIKVIK